jgi:hypothetical protein
MESGGRDFGRKKLPKIGVFDEEWDPSGSVRFRPGGIYTGSGRWYILEVVSKPGWF